jgi:hypothetical protein
VVLAAAAFIGAVALIAAAVSRPTATPLPVAAAAPRRT